MKTINFAWLLSLLAILAFPAFAGVVTSSSGATVTSSSGAPVTSGPVWDAANRQHLPDPARPDRDDDPNGDDE